MAAGGMCAAFLAFVELCADEMAEFGFHDAIVFVGVFDDFPGDFDVLLKRFVAGVNHHAGETFVNALLAQTRTYRRGPDGPRWEWWTG